MSRVGPSRRCLLASLAFLSLSGYLLAGLAPGVGCPNDNPFIVIMKKDGVQLYDTPKRVSSVCKHEFETYGTCCHESQLIPFAQKDTKAIEDAKNRLVLEYKRFSGVMLALVDQIVEVAHAPLETTTGKSSGLISSNIKAARSLVKNTSFLKFYQKYSKSQFKDHQQFEKMNANCWQLLAQERNASICATCSGRSAHFFKAGKMLITEETCADLSSVCKNTVEILVNFIEAIEEVVRINNQIRNSGIIFNLYSKLNIARVWLYFRFFSGYNIHSMIRASRGSKPKNSAYNFLCDTFVRLREPVLVQEFAGLFCQDTAWSISTHPELTAYLAQNKLKNFQAKTEFMSQLHSGVERTNWEIEARLLQFGTGKEMEVLRADAKIVSAKDTSYSSLGLKGRGPLERGAEFP